MRKAFEYDPELIEKVRQIVERGLYRPRERERQLELPLTNPVREPEKTQQ